MKFFKDSIKFLKFKNTNCYLILKELSFILNIFVLCFSEPLGRIFNTFVVFNIVNNAFNDFLNSSTNSYGLQQCKINHLSCFHYHNYSIARVFQQVPFLLFLMIKEFLHDAFFHIKFIVRNCCCASYLYSVIERKIYTENIQ